MEDAVLPQHLLEGEGAGPSSILYALPAGCGHVQDVSVSKPPLAARAAGVQARGYEQEPADDAGCMPLPRCWRVASNCHL